MRLQHLRRVAAASPVYGVTTATFIFIWFR
jgi:hypothetical protein